MSTEQQTPTTRFSNVKMDMGDGILVPMTADDELVMLGCQAFQQLISDAARPHNRGKLLTCRTCEKVTAAAPEVGGDAVVFRYLCPINSNG